MDQKRLTEVLALAVPYGAQYTTNTSPALIIQGVPALASAGCIAINMALVTATGISVTLDYGAGLTTPTTVDQAGFEVAGLNNTLTFATYTTLGAFVDAINGTRFLRAFLVGGIRATASASMLNAFTTTPISLDAGYPVTFTGSAKTLGLAVSGERFVGYGRSGWCKEANLGGDACLNSLLAASLSCTYTTISTSALNVYVSTQAADVLVYSTAFGATTVLKTIQSGAADANTPFIVAPLGSRVVVQAVAAAGTTFSSVECFSFLGKTAVLSGKRVIVAPAV